ncbi:MAG: murein biosynthesis integral membrane protein MurJ [Thermodesulfobacteriota bacterium]|nr:murein biosynthesis integral membrane protein MurJ [Thermodesulfobacteriota bacterium]
MTSHSRRIAKNAAVVAGATLLSRILGFARDLVIAYALGAGLFADAFFVAFRLPNLLRRLFGEGSLTMAFVPVFTRIRTADGEAEAFAMARSILVWLVLILCVITLAAVIFARPLTLLIAPGFADNPGQIELTANLIRICFPYIVLISGVALCMGILNASGHFLAPALAPCILNIVLIASALTAVFFNWSVAHALACGVLMAGVLQWLFQQPFLRSLGFTWRGSWSWFHPGVKRTGLIMLPTVLGAAVYQINILLGTLLASFLSIGSISFLYYADRLVQFPLGVFGLAVSTAALPSLSALAAEKDMEGFKEALNSSLRLTLFICLPASAGLISLSEPIVGLLFGHGAFTGGAVQDTARALVGYALGLPAFALVRPLVSGFYALEDTRTPVLVACVCLVLYVISALVLMRTLSHVGLALATTISSWANFLMLTHFLRRKIGTWADFAGPSRKSAFLSLGLGVGAFLTLPLKFWAVALIPAWALVYLGLALALSLPEAKMILKAVGTRKQKT